MRTNTELREDSRLVPEVAEGTDSPQKAQPLAVEIHEAWLETHRYLNLEALAEQKKTQLHDLELAAA